MRVIHIYVQDVTGYIEVKYKDSGMLHSIEFQFEMEERAYRSMLDHIPISFAMPEFKSQRFSAVEVPEEISFKMFWDRYDDKVFSAKKRSEAQWDRMSKVNRCMAYNYIPKYFSKLPEWQTRKKTAEKYLSDELWNN